MPDDMFGVDSQLNARRRGGYHALASSVDTEKCVFCDLRQKYILREEKGLVLTVNIFPYIDGQLMVIPRRHIESYSEVTEEEAATSHLLSQMAISVLREQMGVEGVWLILRDGGLGAASGKTVRHLHWNIMPYIEGLNTWHYQELTIKPVDLAARLKPFLGNERD